LAMASYIIVFVLVIFMMLREREIQPKRLLITPLLVGYFMLQSLPQTGSWTLTGVLLDVLCLAVGLAIGGWRGSIEQVRMNPISGKVTSKGSFASVILVIGVLLLRMAVSSLGAHYAWVSLSNAMLFVVLGSICARSYVIYTKYRQVQSQ
jgi:membrane protein CcdC involved in cytochrome C biogenesis